MQYKMATAEGMAQGIMEPAIGATKAVTIAVI